MNDVALAPIRHARASYRIGVSRLWYWFSRWRGGRQLKCASRNPLYLCAAEHKATTFSELVNHRFKTWTFPLI
ncbi:MAG: hypothetical protein QOI57_3361 [Rubrobacteraceae bacterium]|nr:hypothetical protein [Rubrobacteraceae bacterium]